MWLRLSFLILLMLGALKLGCSVTPYQTPAVCGCEQTVPDCSLGRGEGTLSCLPAQLVVPLLFTVDFTPVFHSFVDANLFQ